MPKVYSEKERKAITSDLRFHAAQCISTYGIKKTTVDEIVRRAKIAKGTFYLFYKSKELLIFEVIIEWHNSLQNEFIKCISQNVSSLTVDLFTDMLFKLYKRVESMGLITILSNGEIEGLIRKLPEELVIEHLKHDDDMIKKLIDYIPSAKGKNVKIFSAAFRGIFFMLLYRAEVGEHFDKGLKLSIRGLVMQLLEETNDD